MTTPLTAFPADGYVARWQRWDESGDETLTLRWENEGWTAIGEVGAERVTYVLRLSPTWHVRQFLLFRDLADPDLWLGTDGAGRWGEVNGAHRTDLDGCVEIDLACTPFTNSVPIRRLQLDVGHTAELQVATVDVETLAVVPAVHRYEHRAPHRFVLTETAPGPDGHRAEDRAADSPEVQFAVDDYGLPHDVPHRFRRR